MEGMERRSGKKRKESGGPEGRSEHKKTRRDRKKK
jgi:hypothetical protein